MAYRRRMKNKTEEPTNSDYEVVEELSPNDAEVASLEEVEESGITEPKEKVEPEVPETVSATPEAGVVKVRESRKVTKKFPRNISKFSKRLN